MKQNFVLMSLAVTALLIIVQLAYSQTCEPVCANAGVCVATQSCQCREGFTGTLEIYKKYYIKYPHHNHPCGWRCHGLN